MKSSVKKLVGRVESKDCMTDGALNNRTGVAARDDAAGTECELLTEDPMDEGDERQTIKSIEDLLLENSDRLVVG